MKIRKIMLDGKETFKLKCPKCKLWQILDDDQYHGRVSMMCANDDCDFHETHDLSKQKQNGK